MQTAIERFRQYLERRYQGRSTAKHYVSDVRLFAQQMNGSPPMEVTAYDIDRFVEQQCEQGLSPATIHRRLASLRTFFEFLAAEQPDQEWPNPVIWRRHGVRQGTHLPRDAGDAVVAKLLAVIDDVRDRALFSLMVGAGLRVGEVAQLGRDDLEAPRPRDTMARVRVRGKGQKERMVWLLPSVYATVQAWVQQRPPTPTAQLFLNQHGKPLTVAGIQYRLRQHCQVARVQLTCHQLRHTFARRLAEGDMPVESLAKLLGHRQVQTTQVYIAGANLEVGAAFQEAMAQWEACVPGHPTAPPEPVPPPAPPLPERADPDDLVRCQALVDDLPAWVRQPLHQYLAWRWRNWPPHTALGQGKRMAYRLRQTWRWLISEAEVTGWTHLQRSHLETWLQARQQAGVSASTQASELSDLLALLAFVDEREGLIAPNLFRIPRPQRPDALPRALPEEAYQRLEQVVLETTQQEKLTCCLDRAWFFALAHTGVRISELLHLRLADVDLAQGRLWVRGGKNAVDRVVPITPTLRACLERYLALRPQAEDDHLWWTHTRRMSARRVRRRLHLWGAATQQSVTPHQLRHTLATRLVNQGMGIELIRRLLGHKHLSTTQIYARVHDETVRGQFQAAMARLEEQGRSDAHAPLPGSFSPLGAEH